MARKKQLKSTVASWKGQLENLCTKIDDCDYYADPGIEYEPNATDPINKLKKRIVCLMQEIYEAEDMASRLVVWAAITFVLGGVFIQKVEKMPSGQEKCMTKFVELAREGEFGKHRVKMSEEELEAEVFFKCAGTL